jgi:hypothetical protein
MFFGVFLTGSRTALLWTVLIRCFWCISSQLAVHHTDLVINTRFCRRVTQYLIYAIFRGLQAPACSHCGSDDSMELGVLYRSMNGSVVYYIHVMKRAGQDSSSRT